MHIDTSRQTRENRISITLGGVQNARLRKRLQQKGTRSATRLVAMSGRERRLKQDAKHVVSKRIVERYPHALIGLEDLTHIRERTSRRSIRTSGILLFLLKTCETNLAIC